MTRLLETHAPPERMDIQRGTGENDGSKGPKAEKVQRERIQWQSLKQPPCARWPITIPKCRPAWRRALLPAAVVATYLVLGLVAYWPVLPGISNRLFGQTSGLRAVGMVHWLGPSCDRPRAESILHQCHVCAHRRELGTKYGKPTPGVDWRSLD